jgi:hypothetical protein
MKHLFFALLCVPAWLVAQDMEAVDEDALFADTAIITQAPLARADSLPPAGVDQKHFGVSGEMTSVGLVSLPRKTPEDPRLSAYIVGRLMPDARLKDGFKGFADVEARYASETDSVSFHLREIFVDMNIKRRVYFRTGKQVLQWGRCYFWNPTDLINVERKSFIDKIGGREGAYGLKMHAPFGTAVNLYGFIDTRDADSLEKSAGSFKAEFLAGGTEMAVSVWGRKGKIPVSGFDLSTRLFRFDVAGELSFFRQDNEFRMEMRDNRLWLEKGPKQWAPRAALSLTRYFDVNGVPDRLMTVLEGYYNGAGFDSRVFSDTAHYRFEGEVEALTTPSGEPIVFAGIPLVDTLAPVTKLEFFLRNNLYRMNEHAEYYAALFTRFSRFLRSDMALDFRAIMNVPERCAVLSGGVTYTDLRDFTLSLILIGNAGPQDREYTYFGDALSVQASAAIRF